MQKKFNILIVLLFVMLAETSHAVKEVIFRKQTQVYAKQNENSEVLGVYDRGDTIPISTKTYGQWRKVVVDVQGKKTVGWVLSKDIRGARIKDSKARQIEEEEKEDGGVSYRRRLGAGIFGSLNYVYQTKGDVNFSTEVSPGFHNSVQADYSSLSGANVFVGLFGDFNYSDTMAIRGYFTMRKMKRSGSAATDISGAGTGNFTIDQDLLGAGVTAKFYADRHSIFWWGPGIEIAKTVSFDVKGSNVNDPNITGEITDKPILGFVSLSAGYDLNLSGRFYILPEAKFSIIPNGDPLMMIFEVVIPIAFTF